MTRSVVITVLVRGARLIAGFGASIVTARALGAEGRGDYFFVVSVATLVVQFAHLGLASSNTYLVAKRPAILGPLAVNSAWVSVGVGGLAAIIAVAALGWGNWFGVSIPLLGFVLVLVPVTLFYLLGTNILVGAGRILLFNAVETGANLLVLGLILAAAIMLPTAAGVLAASALGWFIASAFLFRLLAGAARMSRQFDRPVFLAGVRYAARAYFVTLLGLLVLRTSVFFIQRVAGSAALGEFSIATQLAEVIGILPASVALVLFPRLARELSGSWFTALRTCWIVGGILVVVCTVVGLLAEPLVRIAYGPTFANSASQLLFLLPGVVFVGMLSVLSQFVAAVGMPISIVWTWAAGVLLVVTLSAWLVPVGGGLGAALALSLSYLALLVMALGVGFAHRAAAK